MFLYVDHLNATLVALETLKHLIKLQTLKSSPSLPRCEYITAVMLLMICFAAYTYALSQYAKKKKYCETELYLIEN